MTALSDWLTGLPHVHGVQPCTVTIKGTVYQAARYTTVTRIDPGCRAYSEGKRLAVHDMIYCVGSLPACKRNGNVAFTVPRDYRDWYIAGYYPAHIRRNPQPIAMPNEFHPFGNAFFLACWDINDGTRIDTYERFAYKRVPITIEEC